MPHDLLARRIVEAAAEEDPLRPPPPALRDLDAGRLFTGEAPPQRWLVGSSRGTGGLLPDAAPVLLAGRGGIGKTHAATELALLVGTWNGTAPAPLWWGRPIAKHGPAVVITYEEHRDSMHRKIQSLCEHHGIDLCRTPEGLMVLCMSDPALSGEPLMAPHPRTRALAPTDEYRRLTGQLRRLHEARGDLGVIVLDHAMTAFQVESNAMTDANAAMRLIGRWAAEFACTVVVLAHTKKMVIRAEMDDEGILQAVMGSNGRVTAVRSDPRDVADGGGRGGAARRGAGGSDVPAR